VKDSGVKREAQWSASNGEADREAGVREKGTLASRDKRKNKKDMFAIA
jgi:hypothetical protein